MVWLCSFSFFVLASWPLGLLDFLPFSDGCLALWLLGFLASSVSGSVVFWLFVPSSSSCYPKVILNEGHMTPKITNMQQSQESAAQILNKTTIEGNKRFIESHLQKWLTSLLPVAAVVESRRSTKLNIRRVGGLWNFPA